MAEDYYKILGVPRSADADAIQKAYRKLARKFHPDLHADKSEKEREQVKQQFQKVQQAYDVLSDANKRAMYDQFGDGYEQMSGAGGNPFGGRPPFGPGGPGPGPGGNPFGNIDLSQIFGGGEGGGGFEDILRQMGGMGGKPGSQKKKKGKRTNSKQKGNDIEQEITIPFAVAVLGGNHQLQITRANGTPESIEVKIPAGIESLKKIRLRGQGHPSPNGGPHGDLKIKVKVAPHPQYTRTGLNLSITVPITLLEAAEGARIDLPTPHGTVSLTVPKGSSGGKSLRLKGMGIRTKKNFGRLDRYVANRDA